MAVLAPRSPVTAEELFDMPDGGGRCELVKGEIVRLTSNGAVHGVVTARIGSALDEYVEANDLDGGDVLPGFACPVRRLFPSDS